MRNTSKQHLTFTGTHKVLKAPLEAQAEGPHPWTVYMQAKRGSLHEIGAII